MPSVSTAIYAAVWHVDYANHYVIIIIPAEFLPLNSTSIVKVRVKKTTVERMKKWKPSNRILPR